MLGQDSLEFRTIIHTTPMDRQVRSGLAELLRIGLSAGYLSPIERGVNPVGGYAFEGIYQDMCALVGQQGSHIHNPEGLWCILGRLHLICLI